MGVKVEIGQHLNIEIRRIGINGEGIGYYQRLAVFVDYVLPGEKVKVIVEQVFANRVIARLVELISMSEKRVEPFCPVYETCGGCQLQHLEYQESLVEKRALIKQAFSRYIAQSISNNTIKETIGASEPKYYRNKATLPVQKIKGKNYLGMYAKGTNHFIPIKDCPIQHLLVNKINLLIIDLMNKYQIDAIDARTKRGCIRFLVVRASKDEKAQVSFIVQYSDEKLKNLVKELVQKEPAIISVYEVINKNYKQITFFTKQMNLLYGKKTLNEQIGNYQFDLMPNAFFQLNNKQAHQLYLTMEKMANLQKDEIAIDAYAGVAPVSHYIAHSAHKVYAIEFEQASCQSAVSSLKMNEIDNVDVICEDFNKGLKKRALNKVDCMIFDPPRTGLANSIETILKYKPKRIIYGSCNPSTLAKDLNLLLKHYNLIKTIPIDMFPYTSHIESVSQLEIKK